MATPRNRKSNRGPGLLWVSDLKTEELQREFYNLMELSSSPVTKKLLSIVQEKIDESQTNTLSNKNYDSPSWALIQADNIGYQRALRFVELLLKDIVK